MHRGVAFWSDGRQKRIFLNSRWRLISIDAETGKPLWDTQIGGAVRGIPMSYAVDGKQYIAIAAGFTLFVFAL